MFIDIRDAVPLQQIWGKYLPLADVCFVLSQEEKEKYI